jgi:hypothetical protein
LAGVIAADAAGGCGIGWHRIAYWSLHPQLGESRNKYLRAGSAYGHCVANR